MLSRGGDLFHLGELLGERGAPAVGRGEGVLQLRLLCQQLHLTLVERWQLGLQRAPLGVEPRDLLVFGAELFVSRGQLLARQRCAGHRAGVAVTLGGG